jgi:phosphoglycolate phosphatase
MRFAALLFDLDGTLVDSLPDLAAGVNTLLAELGRPALADAAIARMIGDGVPKLVERALAASAGGDIPLSAAIERFRTIYEADPTRLTRPYPDVAPTLRSLAGDHPLLAVCTNKTQRATQAVLENLRLAPFFALVVGGDALPRHKPDPDQLLFALDRLGVARYGYGQASLGDLAPDAAIDAFAELPAALQALAEKNQR